MRLWQANGGGAIYWIAAPTCPAAVQALLQCWKAEGLSDDEIEFLEVDEWPSAKDITVRNEDGLSESGRVLAMKATEAAVLACSEWP